MKIVANEGNLKSKLPFAFKQLASKEMQNNTDLNIYDKRNNKQSLNSILIVYNLKITFVALDEISVNEKIIIIKIYLMISEKSY